jgi:hypothetical protein
MNPRFNWLILCVNLKGGSGCVVYGYTGATRFSLRLAKPPRTFNAESSRTAESVHRHRPGLMRARSSDGGGSTGVRLPS